MLRIRVIGGVRADVDGREVDLASAARARGLLAWLAVHPGTHARSVLAARLRPDVRDDSARKSLRQAGSSLSPSRSRSPTSAAPASPRAARSDHAACRRLVRALSSRTSGRSRAARTLRA